MSDRPILFSTPMVRAILREIEQPGTGKTQTRRLLTPQPQPDVGLIGLYAPRLTAVFGYGTPDADCKIPLRYMPGDRLYVREAWRAEAAYDDTPPRDIEYDACMVRYEADGAWSGRDAMTHAGKFRQGMHMPRWASRITLIVTDVRVQRLQEISNEDGFAEGISKDYLESVHGPNGFRDLWDSINGDRPGAAWRHNPWVAAYTFRPILGNIDQIGGT